MSTGESAGNLTRRTVLAGAASVAGVAVLRPLLPCATAGVHLVITDPRLTESRLFRATVGDAVRHIAVEPDLLRQWHAGLREAVRGNTVAGLTSWIDFVVLSGCAREEGLQVMGSHSAASAGHIHQVSWLLAPRD